MDGEKNLEMEDLSLMILSDFLRNDFQLIRYLVTCF